MKEPYLFRYKQKCSTKQTNNEQLYYDDKVDMMMIVENGVAVPAIYNNSNIIPMTKKADMEKGEDSKDTVMWS